MSSTWLLALCFICFCSQSLQFTSLVKPIIDVSNNRPLACNHVHQRHPIRVHLLSMSGAVGGRVSGRPPSGRGGGLREAAGAAGRQPNTTPKNSARGGGAAGAGAGRGGSVGKPSKEMRKQGNRAKQLEAMQQKAAKEEAFFRQCQREANKGVDMGVSKERSEEELFQKQGSQGINFDNYDKIDVEVKGKGADAVPALRSFKGLGETLPPFLARNVGLMNYERPTPIQKHAVPLALAGRDLMCCAQTGSGKTCAFLLPIVAALGRANKGGRTAAVGTAAMPRCVVMAPTRELASQINVEAEKLCSRSGLRSVVVYGGANQRAQIRELAAGVDIIVATPGRLTDFVQRGMVSLSKVSFLVLDEADRMLDMGFEPQIRRIVLEADMPPKERRQTLLFSATFAPEIQTLARAFLRDYVWIAVGRVGSTVENIRQQLVLATPDKRHKLRLVVQALRQVEGRTLVFVQKKRTASWLKKALRAGGPDKGAANPQFASLLPDTVQTERFAPVLAEEIHGDRSQAQREAALNAFREGACRVLVATDVCARGLDIAGVEHVINMDLPLAKDDFDSYVHRIGRTGRAGHAGLATSFYVPGHEPKAGNGPIAAALLQQLRETGSEIPDWFASLPECGGGGGAGGKKEFGGSDVRGSAGTQQQRRQEGGVGGGREGGGRGGGGGVRGGGGARGRTGREGGKRGGGGGGDGGGEERSRGGEEAEGGGELERELKHSHRFE